MNTGDVLYVDINYDLGSDQLDIMLVGEDGQVEANPTAPLVDLDGNAYTTVTINKQEWIVENFRCTKYADGSSIPNITDGTAWIGDADGAYCWYDNDEATYKADYGALYNFWAVSHTKGLAYLERGGVRDQGWRVATLADWTALKTFASNGGADEPAPKLRMDGEGVWSQAPNTATNDYGFSAVPGGRRRGDTGVFEEAGGIYAAHWTSTPEASPPSAWHGTFTYILVVDVLNIENGGEEWGMSVRLVRDV
jgi:uncharacterized protein (TIGR02145 family)